MLEKLRNQRFLVFRHWLSFVVIWLRRH